MIIRTFYMLTKPGIIFGNIVTTAAGFALASRGNIDIWLFLETLLGLAFVIASAGVFNNYIDRVMDLQMERTKNRPLANGSINPTAALAFASILGLIGISILYIFTNLLTVIIGIAGFLAYLVLYTIWKYRSFNGTLVGSISGAIPPVVGYTAVTNQLDVASLLLFVILILWQMPHFYAIAIYRLKDYSAASIPLLPVVKGTHVTKIHMVCYIAAFILTSVLLTFLGYTGVIYLTITSLLGLVWLALSFKGFTIQDEVKWGKQMFFFSLVVIMGICLTMSIDVVPL